MSFISELHNYLRAAYPLIWVQTHEEARLIREVTNHYVSDEANAEKFGLYTWDAINGLALVSAVKDASGTKTGIVTTPVEPEHTAKYSEIIKYIGGIQSERRIFILKDFHPFLEAPGAIRQIRNVVPTLVRNGNMIIFVSPIVKVPIELNRDIQFLDFSLPDEPEISKQLDFVKASYEHGTKTTLELDPTVKQEAIDAAKGMTTMEVQNAYSLGLIQVGKMDKPFVRSVFNQKVEKIRKMGLLQYLEPTVSFQDIGGLDGLKKWMRTRSLGFSKEAQAFGLNTPKGVLLCGHCGTGKSMIAKAAAAEFNLPAWQLDIGSLFGQYIGTTESNFRQVIQIIEAMGPCLVYVD